MDTINTVMSEKDRTDDSQLPSMGRILFKMLLIMVPCVVVYSFTAKAIASALGY